MGGVPEENGTRTRDKELGEASSIGELINEIQEFVATVKRIHRTVYQLAFIISSNGPGKDEAMRYVNMLIASGLVSPAFFQKALNDVKRWRKYRYRLSDDMEYEYDEYGGSQQP